jgi:hypothetical protein
MDSFDDLAEPEERKRTARQTGSVRHPFVANLKSAVSEAPAPHTIMDYTVGPPTAVKRNGSWPPSVQPVDHFIEWQTALPSSASHQNAAPPYLGRRCRGDT